MVRHGFVFSCDGLGELMKGFEGRGWWMKVLLLMRVACGWWWGDGDERDEGMGRCGVRFYIRCLRVWDGIVNAIEWVFGSGLDRKSECLGWGSSRVMEVGGRVTEWCWPNEAW